MNSVAWEDLTFGPKECFTLYNGVLIHGMEYDILSLTLNSMIFWAEIVICSKVVINTVIIFQID